MLCNQKRVFILFEIEQTLNKKLTNRRSGHVLNLKLFHFTQLKCYYIFASWQLF
jgi:hypothetical protein